MQPIAADAPRLIEARGLRVSYDIARGWFRHRRFDAVRDATLALSRGETLGIVGESGSGKTTLGMALLALQPIADGSVALDGEPLGGDAESRRQTAPADAGRVPGSVRLAQPAHDGRQDRRRGPGAAPARALARSSARRW